MEIRGQFHKNEELKSDEEWKVDKWGVERVYEIKIKHVGNFSAPQPLTRQLFPLQLFRLIMKRNLAIFCSPLLNSSTLNFYETFPWQYLPNKFLTNHQLEKNKFYTTWQYHHYPLNISEVQSTTSRWFCFRHYLTKPLMLWKITVYFINNLTWFATTV